MDASHAELEPLVRTLEALPGAERARWIADLRSLSLPARVPPWTPTGMRVRRSEELSFFCAGRVTIAPELGLWGRPRVLLWARVGALGPVFKAPHESFSVAAPAEGDLDLAICHGEWATPDGRLATPREAYASLEGGFGVVVIRWNRRAAEGLAALRALAPEDPWLAGEAARTASPHRPPPGWEPHWRIGASEVFEARRAEGDSTIDARCDDDVSIVRKPVERVMRPDTRLEWRWRVSSLPSSRPEDQLVSHDYFGPAVEFETGRDLSYLWSASLATGTHFACPIPHWAPREAHWVVRSGAADLGRWVHDARPLASDAQAVYGERGPQRVVAVWLIAVSVFQHGCAAAEIADLTLADSQGRVSLL